MAIVAAVVIVLVSSGSSSPPAAVLPPSMHRAGPETIYTAGAALKTDTAATLDTLEKMGVNRVRVFMTWNQIAPDPTATRAPAGFDAANPAAYPAASWAQYDTIIKAVEDHHMGLDVVLGPPPPRWAEGKGAPNPVRQTFWKPNARDFQEFVQSVGERYSGHYTPAGASKPLPRVAFWSIWNEPNLGVQLAPQTVDHNTVEESALMYRKLADAAWNGLQASGHGKDLTLIGETAPAGGRFAGAPGNFSAMAPLRFLRALYCVDAAYRPLTGAAATARGCPATAAASAHFRAEHPALFRASAFADHPYPQGLPPNEATPNEPDYAELASIDRLTTALDRMQTVYGSHKRFQIYDTEFGYQTAPPDTQGGAVSPGVAAEWLNWAEYLHWRNPRIASYDQYLLRDPDPVGPGPYTALCHRPVDLPGRPQAHSGRVHDAAVSPGDPDRVRSSVGGLGMRSTGDHRSSHDPSPAVRRRCSTGAGTPDRSLRWSGCGCPRRIATSTYAQRFRAVAPLGCRGPIRTARSSTAASLP